ncbi:hypothetical protein TNCV_3076381 [Trichonephila clavipes]|nr:hypothetical protein TNCV_3076381 [Trichonephila clavipes]
MHGMGITQQTPSGTRNTQIGYHCLPKQRSDELTHSKSRQIQKEPPKETLHTHRSGSALYVLKEIFWKIEEPGARQHPRRLAFTERQRSKETDRRMAQRRHYTSEVLQNTCKSNRNGKRKMDLRECH